jgi:4-amino-4-deoxy-L-arabinose transferase-like glycosyltransferase
VAAGIILLVAAAIRLAQLHTFGPHSDELAYARWAVQIWRDHTRAGLLIPILDDGKQPLLFWIQAVLYGLGLPPLTAGRVLSATAGTLTVALVFTLARRLTGVPAALAAAGLSTFFPFAVLHDRLGLSDSPLVLALVITAYASLRATQEASWRWTALAAVGGMAAAGIKGPGVCAAAFPILAALLFSPLRGAALLRQALPAALTVAVYGVQMYGPLGERYRYQTALHTIDLNQPLPALVAAWRENADVFFTYMRAYFSGPWFALLLGLVLLPLLTRRRGDLWLLGCTAAVVLPVVFAGWEIYSRYFLGGLPFVAALWGSLVHSATPRAIGKTRLRARPLTALLVGVATALLLPLAWQSMLLVIAPGQAALAAHDRWQYLTGPSSGWGFREAADALERDAGGRLVFVLTRPSHSETYDYIFLRFLDSPTIKHYVEWDIRQGTRSSLARWYTHGVPIYLFANSGREEPEAIERNWPDATVVARVRKPAGGGEVVVYRLPAPH